MNQLIPVTQVPVVPPEQAAIAERNFEAILQASPWIGTYGKEVLKIMDTKMAPVAKVQRFRKLADKIAAAVYPHSACTQGCSHCCHIPVEMTSREAALIGKEIGRAPQPVARVGIDKAMRLEDFSTTCPFLKAGKCSIYASRPLACRLHFNISNLSSLCDTSVTAAVPNLDLRKLHQALAMEFLREPWGDLREFFPAT